MTDDDMFADQERSNWVRLQTLVKLRWYAIAGQTFAVIVALYLFDLSLETGIIALIVGSSALANIIFGFLYPESRRLKEREAFFVLTFDVLQLGLLLAVTGGLNNPFAMLLLAPVTIAATVLHGRSTVILGALAISLITILSQYAVPLLTANGDVLALPSLFKFGFWIALVIGVIFLASYARQVTEEMHVMSEALLATQLALSRAQKLTDLGGVVAATAHELGTPLATIKLVSGEMVEELADREDLIEDITLIRQEADRCRDILHSMGRAGKDDLHLRNAPIEAVVREAAEPHTDRGKLVLIDIAADGDAPIPQPVIPRKPETIHGLRNLIQNAVDFAGERVEIDVSWSLTHITIRIADDGGGFPSAVLGRIGDPMARSRRNAIDARRPEYRGMGLGLFIAKTLLERTGASLNFANRRQVDQPTQAVVTVAWRRTAEEALRNGQHRALGDNQPFV
ncbi:sensor histidine kinase RegB [Yoonia sp. 208BN28-4]|uniref:sensor histidine kinase RegB n=1 Tax=Yoonia sp. 208BN28-4 TaxID=3126505 RepID=UPI0030A5FFFF